MLDQGSQESHECCSNAERVLGSIAICWKIVSIELNVGSWAAGGVLMVDYNQAEGRCGHCTFY